MSNKTIILTTVDQKHVATFESSEVPIKGDKIFIKERSGFEVDFRVFNIDNPLTIVLIGKELQF